MKNARTHEQLLADARKPRQTKYHNVKTVVDGITFGSKDEAARYAELQFMEAGGKIRDLVVHPKFEITIGGVKVCTYTADSSYWEQRKGFVIEDVKSGPTRTTAYRLKKRLMKAVLGLTVEEWPGKEREP